uniref:Protein-serine O-palmitoleoyltransferase porcupine n=1 Tax=Strongyloides stercoralis TaxID=6248 RepID=A0A0K0EQT9_STRER
MSFVGLPDEDIHSFMDMLTDEERLQLQNIYSEINKSYPEKIYELIYTIFSQFKFIILICLFQRIIISFGSSINRNLLHVLFGIIGFYVLSDRNDSIPTVTIHFSYFFCLFLTIKIFKSYPIIPFIITLIFTFSFQFYLKESMYSSIHGSLMIMSMKMISLTFENSINLFEVFGYAFSPGTLLYGPFITIRMYRLSYQTKFFSNLFIPILSSILSGLFLFLSHFILTDIDILNYNSLLINYKTAASFRYSHYFISYISLTLASLSGIPIDQVTSWLSVEVPRSMMNVACYWNVPMHLFFHKYVFQKLRNYGKFTAVLITFAFSAMLHGFNFQLTAVLISIGINASIESKLRNRLSSRLNSCCKSRECLENCNHQYKKYHFRTIIVNIVFLIVNIYHLIYLGAPFDDNTDDGRYSMGHTLKIWSQEFYFISPIVTLFTWILSFLI